MARVPRLLACAALAWGAASCNCGGTPLHQATPELTLQNELDFGPVQVGTLGTKKLTVSNQGTASLQITQATIGLGGSVFTLISTPSTIAPGDSAQLNVGYLPVGLGPDNGTLVLTSNDPNATQVTVILKGGPNPGQGTCDAGACTEGQTRTVSCGGCGMEMDRCSNACQWVLGACVTPDAGCGATDAGPAPDAGATDSGGPIDAGPAPDAGQSDAGTPDAGTPDSGSSDAGCKPDWTWTLANQVVYTCCFGVVTIQVDHLVFSSSGSTLTVMPQPQWSPSAAGWLTGPSTTCPGGDFSVAELYAGTCNEHYALDGGFTSPTTWVGTLTMDYTESTPTGQSCACYGVDVPCTAQSFAISASHP